MKAVVLTNFGGTENLKLEGNFPEPQIKENSVLVKVKATALTRLDIWRRKGSLPFKPSLPHILGSDISGIVEKVGNLVKGINIGDEVVISPGISCGVCYRCLKGEDNLCKEYGIIGLKSHGGYAEYIAVPQENIIRKPKNLSFEEAASYPLTFLTAWNALVNKGKIKAGMNVLIWGGSSGIGTAAIQIAKLFSTFVITTVGSQDKREKCEEIGADIVLDHYKDDVPSTVLKTIGGVDLVLDHIGKATFDKSIQCLKKGGKLIFMGTTTGGDVDINLRSLFTAEISLLGVYMGRKSDLLLISDLLERGKLKPVLDKVFTLEEASKAHDYLERGNHFGKVVLKVC